MVVLDGIETPEGCLEIRVVAWGRKAVGCSEWSREWRREEFGSVRVELARVETFEVGVADFGFAAVLSDRSDQGVGFGLKDVKDGMVRDRHRATCSE